MKKIIIFIFFIGSLSFFAESCGKCECIKSTDPCNGLSFKFATNVQPIINASCATSPGCHATGSINSGGPLTNYSQIFDKRALINVQVSSGTMPFPPDSLNSDQKNKIICWINSGAPDN
jgi:hypothetical protein